MLRTIGLLCLAACAGVTIVTAGTCGVGLLTGTGTWCGLPLYWVFGFPPAIVFAVVLGVPAHFIFQRLRLRAWWLFGLVGFLFALPVWYSLAQPFTSSRWIQSGFFDSLNYLSSGVVAGLTYWWLAIKRNRQNAL